MAWKLNKADDIECLMDDSGVYTIITRIAVRETHKEYAGTRISVRVDIITDHTINETCVDEPLQSFIGIGDNVRKHTIRWIKENNIKISLEHASYIGAECERAMLEPHFVQR